MFKTTLPGAVRLLWLLWTATTVPGHASARPSTGVVADARGSGLLLLVEFDDATTAAAVASECLLRRTFVRQTGGTGIRIFPALNITRDELLGGLATLRDALVVVASTAR